jgi:hypothetical protein
MPNIFFINIPAEAISNSSVQQMTLSALMLGCGPYVTTDGVCYPINETGINFITNDHLSALSQFSALGITCTGKVGQRFIELTNAEYEGDVPVDFPNSSITTMEGEEPIAEQMKMKDYFKRGQMQSVDETKWMVEISKVPPGADCGDGLSWEDYQIYFNTFGSRIIGLKGRQSLIDSEAYGLVHTIS